MRFDFLRIRRGQDIRGGSGVDDERGLKPGGFSSATDGAAIGDAGGSGGALHVRSLPWRRALPLELGRQRLEQKRHSAAAITPAVIRGSVADETPKLAREVALVGEAMLGGHNGDGRIAMNERVAGHAHAMAHEVLVR